MDFYRTPENVFEHLPDYPFAPHYAQLGQLRMHYVDEGPRDAAPVLMLHGEPTWSYLYRHMIPICAHAGSRVLAPDLIGFGKSDKPVRKSDYSYAAHVSWVTQFVRELGLQNITLFCQDWGSLIGLRVAAENPERFARIIIGNGALPTGFKGPLPPIATVLPFLAWRAFATYSPWFPISGIVDFGCLKKLSPGELAAYDAPFPDRRARAGARMFPRLVPLSPGDPSIEPNRRAWEVLRRWQKPFLTVFSDGDPITRGGDRAFRAQVPGASGQPHATPHAGHFLQEDAGPELARRINAFIASTPA